MHARWISSIVLLIFPFAAAAQTTTPANPPPNSGVTLRAKALTVLVDVVVTDRHGNPVKNLIR